MTRVDVTDEEWMRVRLEARRARMKVPEWVAQAIREKLAKEDGNAAA